MKQLGYDQVYQNKLEISEFDHLEALLASGGKLRYREVVYHKRGAYRIENSNYYLAREGTGSVSVSQGIEIGQRLINNVYHIYQVHYEFDLSWWQASFQLLSMTALVEGRLDHVHDQPGTIVCYNYPPAITSFVPINTLLANGAWMGSLWYPPPPSGASMPCAFFSGARIFLAVPLTANYNSLLYNYSGQNPSQPFVPYRRLVFVTHAFVEGVPPTARQMFIQCDRCTLQIFYSVP